MALTTKTYVLYVLVAVTVGFVFAFGYSGLSYHPLPLQVKEDIYHPAPAPTGAIPTLAPQPIKKSTADKPTDPNDPYAPAPAPVVVTTQPLPDITPVTTLNPCCINSNFNNTYQTIATQVYETYSGLLVIVLLLVAVLAVIIVVGLFGYFVRETWEKPGNEEGFAQTIISAIMAFMIVGVMVVIVLPILNSVMLAAPSITCVC